MITCDMDHGPVNLALTFQLPTEAKSILQGRNSFCLNINSISEADPTLHWIKNWSSSNI